MVALRAASGLLLLETTESYDRAAGAEAVAGSKPRQSAEGLQARRGAGYGLNHWDGLVRFLEDGRIEIDSNTVERSIRPLALARKNALFAGHDLGAESWAMIASLIETCKLNAVDPLAWMTDVLTKLVNRWPASKIDELMPWTYAKPA